MPNKPENGIVQTYGGATDKPKRWSIIEQVLWQGHIKDYGSIQQWAAKERKKYRAERTVQVQVLERHVHAAGAYFEVTCGVVRRRVDDPE